MYSALLALHLIAVAASSAAPLFCAWLEWKHSRGDELAGRAGRSLAWTSFWLLALGAVLGLIIGALAWTPDFRAALGRLGMRLHWAGAEWIFSLLLMGVHALWWKLSPRPGAALRWVRISLPLLAATNLLYHFPTLFYVLEQVLAESSRAAARGAELATEPLTSAEFRRRMGSAPVLAKTVHFWLASLVAAGLLLIWSGRKADAGEAAAGDGGPDDGRTIVWGARAALAAAFLQIPVGLWLLMQLSPAAQRAMMGGDMAASALLVVGVFTSLGLMHLLASLAFGRARKAGADALRQRAAAVVAVGVVVLLLMTFAARRARPLPPASEDSPAAASASAADA